MSNRVLCKGGCGEEATFNGWCKIKWVSGNKYGVACKIIKEKTARKISEFRIEEGKMGKNPMQNPLICAKNHSQERNRKGVNRRKINRDVCFITYTFGYSEGVNTLPVSLPPIYH